ncbi:MAG: sulfurtransferase [Arcobacter sp.]|nr:MAG: sulfurtransferase [Arcobacter sp.]
MNVYPDIEMLENSDMKVVDIRTPMEWQETGVVPGSTMVTFFDQMGNYDAESFLKAMDELGGKDVEIGLICRTGNRTAQVAGFMAQQGYNVKNLDGGVTKLINEGYDLDVYKP